MGISVEQMRAAIYDVYPGWAWKEKVDNMLDDQVIAIYYSFLKKGKFEQKPKKYSKKHNKRERISDDTMFEVYTGEQLSFDI